MTGKHTSRWAIILLALGVLLALSLACNATGSKGVQPTSPPQGETVEPPPAPGAAPSPEELAQSVVQLTALTGNPPNWRPVWTGSGSIVDPSGLILTNAHVVDNRADEYDALGVAITKHSDELPELDYLAQVLTVDYDLDLAVVRIVSDLEGNAAEVNLPSVSIGDSNSVEIGEKLSVLGYPGIGGETITFTEGAVSGFTLERGVEGRAWIKTDATIAGGNSGGMAINVRGELIGVPTIVSSGAEQAETVDCRPLADTNRDGRVDEGDTCIPVGGFINALRPVNLASPLIEAAMEGRSYAAGEGIPAQAGSYNLDDVLFYHLEFSDGVTEDDRPTQLWYALPAGASDLCVFWDYKGMVDGMPWGVHWFFESEYLEDASLPSEVWNGGPEGNWWACIYDDQGLEPGLYEAALEVDGEFIASESVFVGGGRHVVDFTIDNQSGETICYVWLSPSKAQNWGMDKLGDEEVIDPGESHAFKLASGEYDVSLLDCDLQTLAEDYNLDLQEDQSFTFTGS